MQWRNWFGDEFFDIRGESLVSGAKILYREGFRYVDTTANPCPNQRFWVFQKLLPGGGRIVVKYDQGSEAKREGPHWKIYTESGGRYTYFNHRGDTVEFDAQNAHMKAGRRGYVRGFGGNQYEMDMPPIYREGTNLITNPTNNTPRMEIGPYYGPEEL